MTGCANIQLEPSVTVKTQDLDALGENFEKSSKGFIDFLLLNEEGFPFIVLEFQPCLGLLTNVLLGGIRLAGVGARCHTQLE